MNEHHVRLKHKGRQMTVCWRLSGVCCSHIVIGGRKCAKTIITQYSPKSMNCLMDSGDGLNCE